MYKMFVIDDNTWDREGIRDTFDWAGMGIEIAGIFPNGKLAFNKVNELRPDIILTDIAMPVMNGIELAKELKIIAPGIKVIFMSSYNEFDFARSAIDLDIYGYVLKPIIPEILTAAIGKVISTYASENLNKKEKEEMQKQLRDSLPLLQEQFLRDLAFGLCSDPAEIKDRLDFLKVPEIKDYDIQITSAVINNYEDLIHNMSADDKFSAAYLIKKILNSFSNSKTNIYSLQISERDFASIIFFDNCQVNNKKTDILDMIIAMKEEMYNRLDLNVTIGISNVSDNTVNIPDLYRQSIAAAKTRFYGEKVQVIHYREIEVARKGTSDKELDLHVLYIELNELVSYGDEKATWDFIGKYFSKENAVYSESYIKSLTFSIINTLQIVLIESDESFSNIFDESMLIWQKLDKFDTILNIRQWVYNILTTVKDYLNKKHISLNHQVVKDIKKFVKERYMDQLTINDIADSVYFSALHANNLFRNETGKTIFDYLTEFRIDMAKKLLKNPYSRIYSVAQNVGYTNKSHFCMIFKKFTGLTPTEYKNKAVL